MMHALEIKNLTIAFASREKTQVVVDQFNLILKSGCCMGLVGESGSGKTLSALAILQLLPYGAGVSPESEILFQNENLLNYSEKKMRAIRGKEIGIIFQDAMSALNPVLTIGQQLSEIIKLHLKLNKRERQARCLELLREMGIDDVKRCYESYPHQLSGGMRQRAMIAIAIAAEPKIIIADEPTTALDVTIQKQVLDLLRKLKETRNCALLFIGHDLSVVASIADDITVLKNGKIIEENNTNDFFNNPKEIYSQQLINAVLPNLARIHAVNPEKNKPILAVDQLKIYFPIRSGFFKKIKSYVKAVDNISFDIKSGETLAIVGESGSGKTTTAKGILQLIKNTSGDINFSNIMLNKISSSKLRKLRADMQIIFQDPFSALNPRMLILDSLSEGLIIQQKIKNKKEIIPIISKILEQVELPADIIYRYPHEFSGGQRQRICIARALTLSPKLLILDEPTSALDVSTQQQILELLDKLQQSQGISYLLITHNLSVVAYLAHRVAVMYQGKIVETGFTQNVLQFPQHDYTKQLLSSVPEL